MNDVGSKGGFAPIKHNNLECNKANMMIRLAVVEALTWENIDTIKRRFTESGRPQPKKQKSNHIDKSEEKSNIRYFYAFLNNCVYRGLPM